MEQKQGSQEWACWCWCLDPGILEVVSHVTAALTAGAWPIEAQAAFSDSLVSGAQRFASGRFLICWQLD